MKIWKSKIELRAKGNKHNKVDLILVWLLSVFVLNKKREVKIKCMHEIKRDMRKATHNQTSENLNASYAAYNSLYKYYLCS